MNKEHDPVPTGPVGSILRALSKGVMNGWACIARSGHRGTDSRESWLTWIGEEAVDTLYERLHARVIPWVSYKGQSVSKREHGGRMTSSGHSESDCVDQCRCVGVC